MTKKKDTPDLSLEETLRNRIHELEGEIRELKRDQQVIVTGLEADRSGLRIENFRLLRLIDHASLMDKVTP